MSAPGSLVLFGATGDLAAKMLLPALYQIDVEGGLEDDIVGVALDDIDTAQFRRQAMANLKRTVDSIDSGVAQRFQSRLHYVSGDYTKKATFADLSESLGPGRFLHYLAIPPDLFETVINGLGSVGLLSGARVLVEKPFGRDAESAQDLDHLLHGFLPEEALYRIDHYLGKEPVENILALRHANPVLGAVWNRDHIDHVQITMAESFGVADRGSLYDDLGVVRDVVQNHLLQVLCMLTMDAPRSPEAGAMSDARYQLLQTVDSIESDQAVLGQYDGYRSVEGVSENSTTPTFVALRLNLSHPRWAGVPIYIRAGKKMAVTCTQAVVRFKGSKPLRFSADPHQPDPNQLVITLGPTDEVVFEIQTKQPGEGIHLVTTPLSVSYDDFFPGIPSAYQRIFLDAMAGDRSIFAREDAVAEAWRIVTEILDPPQEPIVYPNGSWGPPEADRILGANTRWVNPT